MRLQGKLWIQVVAVLLMLALSGVIGYAADKEKVVLQFSYAPFGFSAGAEQAFWPKYIKKFEEENPGIKVNLTWESWDNFHQKTHIAAESGNVPDLSFSSPGTNMPIAARGLVLPVDDVIRDLGGPEAFVPSNLAPYQLDGKTYGVPNCDNNIVLAYRKDFLKAAGYNGPPKTWDELVEISKACTKDGVYGLGLYLARTHDTRQVYEGMMWAAGGCEIDKNGNVVLNSPENLVALKFYTDFHTRHKVVPPSAVSWKYGDNANIIGTGQVAMTPIYGGYGTLMKEMFPDVYEQIGFVEMPVGPTGHSGSRSGVGAFFIFSKARHPDEAKKFIKFMSRPEIHKEWCIISGNVSPFKAIANDPDLTRFEWYKAIARQSPTAIQPGFVYGPRVKGLDVLNGLHVMAEPVVGVVSEGLTPEESLKKAHQHYDEIVQEAKKK